MATKHPIQILPAGKYFSEDALYLKHRPVGSVTLNGMMYEVEFHFFKGVSKTLLINEFDLPEMLKSLKSDWLIIPGKL